MLSLGSLLNRNERHKFLLSHLTIPCYASFGVAYVSTSVLQWYPVAALTCIALAARPIVMRSAYRKFFSVPAGSVLKRRDLRPAFKCRCPGFGRNDGAARRVARSGAVTTCQIKRTRRLCNLCFAPRQLTRMFRRMQGMPFDDSKASISTAPF